MLKTHLIIAWRNIWKYRMLSLINVSGLAIGIAACITIMLFVADEYSYDRYNQYADRIVRVVLKGKISDELISEAVTPAPIVRAAHSDMSGLISRVQTLWSQFNTDEPFTYTVLNESYRKVYTAESNLRSVLRVFTVLTISVALIGLFGLVTFTTEQKFKEIGIRKVLGSSVPQIVSLLTRDFLKLIGISFLLAFPVAFYLVNQWLQDFVYRIDISWWVFAVAASLTVVMALITISLRSIKAALANPVDALRNE